MKILTDNLGNEYELVPYSPIGRKQTQQELYVIKPLEVKKRWSVTSYSDPNNTPYIHISWDNEEQAEALRDKITKLMEEEYGN